MRLIDADALHETLKTKQKWVVRCGDKHNEGYTYDQVHFAIDDAPTIDAVEVVRCKDCANWKNGHICLAWSRFGTIETKPNMWCCYWRLNDEN